MSRYFGTASIVEEGDQGSSPQDWASYPAPPMVTAEGVPTASGESNDGSGGGWLDSLASIFRSTAIGVSSVAATANQGQRPGYYPTQPMRSAMPGWVIPAAVGVGVIGILVIMKSNRRAAVAGYRRRKHRKSRR